MTSELLTITNVPGRVPTADGLNVRFTTHFPPAGSGDKERQLSDSEKSPVVFRLIARTGALAMLVRVTLWEGLAVPTA